MYSREVRFDLIDRERGCRWKSVQKQRPFDHATMAQSAARKSHNLEVVSSSLTCRIFFPSK